MSEIESSLPLAIFYSNSKTRKYRLKYHDNQLTWDNRILKSQYEEKIIPIENLISVKLHNSKQFTIYYAERKTNNKWRQRYLTLNHSDEQLVSLWISTIKNGLKVFSHRPKELLLFVNPYGGKKGGLKIFYRYTKPLLDIAGINVTVIISEEQNHIRDLLISYNLDPYDSLGCIGGDGTVSEIINGLVLRECRVHGIDPNDANQILPKPTLACGIIPGGSTNTTAYCLNGTSDITTAVLNIILGYTLGLDLVSVRDRDNLVRLYADIISYGYLGDIAHYSEKLRWMGPLRYDYIGCRKLFANAGYSGEVNVLIDSTKNPCIKCYKNCEECDNNRHPSLEISAESNYWKTIKGTFFMISGANLSCAGERNPNGLAPFSHVGNGYLYLVIARHTSFFQNLKTMQRFVQTDYNVDDLLHIEMYRTKEFKFTASDSPGRWNCDGEVIKCTDIEAKVHRQLITVYGRGVSKPTKNVCICSV